VAMVKIRGPHVYAHKTYLSMKPGSLFCFVCQTEISQTTASCCTLGIFGKLLMCRAAPTWFEMVWRLVFSPRLVLGNFTPSLQTFITEEV
jgi:hypothetical protein